MQRGWQCPGSCGHVAELPAPSLLPFHCSVCAACLENPSQKPQLWVNHCIYNHLFHSCLPPAARSLFGLLKSPSPGWPLTLPHGSARLGRAAVECRAVAVHTRQMRAPSRPRQMGLCSPCKRKTFQLSHNICTRGTLFGKQNKTKKSTTKHNPTDNQTVPGRVSVALSNACCNWVVMSGIPAWGGFGGLLLWLAAPSGGTCQMLETGTQGFKNRQEMAD